MVSQPCRRICTYALVGSRAVLVPICFTGGDVCTAVRLTSDFKALGNPWLGVPIDNSQPPPAPSFKVSSYYERVRETGPVSFSADSTGNMKMPPTGQYSHCPGCQVLKKAQGRCWAHSMPSCEIIQGNWGVNFSQLAVTISNFALKYKFLTLYHLDLCPFS